MLAYAFKISLQWLFPCDIKIWPNQLWPLTLPDLFLIGPVANLVPCHNNHKLYTANKQPKAMHGRNVYSCKLFFHMPQNEKTL